MNTYLLFAATFMLYRHLFAPTLTHVLYTWTKSDEEKVGR